VLQFGEIMEMMKYIPYIFGQVIHLFYLSLQGQKLIDHSVLIRDKM